MRAKKPKRLPVVLTRDEVERILTHLSGEYRLMAQLLYGSGLRLIECIRLRVKDIDFAQRQDKPGLQIFILQPNSTVPNPDQGFFASDIRCHTGRAARTRPLPR